jgi:hypothetical protein
VACSAWSQRRERPEQTVEVRAAADSTNLEVVDPPRKPGFRVLRFVSVYGLVFINTCYALPTEVSDSVIQSTAAGMQTSREFNLKLFHPPSSSFTHGMAAPLIRQHTGLVPSTTRAGP